MMLAIYSSDLPPQPSHQSSTHKPNGKKTPLPIAFHGKIFLFTAKPVIPHPPQKNLSTLPPVANSTAKQASITQSMANAMPKYPAPQALYLRAQAPTRLADTAYFELSIFMA